MRGYESEIVRGGCVCVWGLVLKRSCEGRCAGREGCGRGKHAVVVVIDKQRTTKYIRIVDLTYCKSS